VGAAVIVGRAVTTGVGSEVADGVAVAVAHGVGFALAVALGVVVGNPVGGTEAAGAWHADATSASEITRAAPRRQRAGAAGLMSIAIATRQRDAGRDEPELPRAPNVPAERPDR
jgi:hypothetical protein